MITSHALSQAKTRMSAIGFSLDLLYQADRLANCLTEDTAIILAKSLKRVKTKDKSNGFVLYAIARNQSIVTVMWREHDQPQDRLNVHSILSILAPQNSRQKVASLTNL